MKKKSNINEIFAFALHNHKKNNLKTAEKFYKKVLNVSPNHFNSVYLLGSLLLQVKKYDLAIKLLQKAIQIQPNHSDSYNNLGNVMLELGEFTKAINCYEKAIKIKPNQADAYYNYGIAQKKLGELRKSISYYEKVIQINPYYLNVHNNLGSVFEKLGEYQKAINCYKKEIQIQPNHAGAHYNLGLVYADLGKYEKAVNWYEKSIQIQPINANAYYNLGNVMLALGEFTKAINCYEKAVKYEPKNLEYYHSLSLLKKEILDKNLKSKVNKIMKKENFERNNLAYGNFLLSKYELNKKNYEEEFQYLLKGHSHYFQAQKENFEKLIEYVMNVLPKINKLVDVSKLRKNSKKRDIQIKPIFIVGVPRCGSTLVEKVIASGSKYIPAGEETGILSSYIKKQIFQKKRLTLKKEDFETQLFEKYEQKELVKEKSNYTFTDKSLENFFYISLIKEIFPKAKVINCRRNELSSIMSILQNIQVKNPWAHDVENIFKYFDIYIRKIDNFHKIYPNFIYELKYEKLVNSPEEESKKLMKFCELPWDKKCLEFYKREDLVSKTASNIQIRKAIYKHSPDKYLPYKKFLEPYGKKYSWFN